MKKTPFHYSSEELDVDKLRETQLLDMAIVETADTKKHGGYGRGETTNNKEEQRVSDRNGTVHL